MSTVQEKLLRYVSVYTTSDPESMNTPSHPRINDLAEILVEEIKALGIENVSLDEHGYVMAKIPANTTKEVPTIGFLAHMDTSPDTSGENVKPQIIENYDGGPITLEGTGAILDPAYFSNMKDYIGQTLITTDGTTLLGADDKAGIAEIMTAMQYLMEHPKVEHGDVVFAFNPDEEIGRGVVKFDVEKFGADFAYTLDGGRVGELQYENFNAASMKLTIAGKMVHPGDAKGKLINALQLAIRFNEALPVIERPEYTEGYEGFYHLTDLNGDASNAVIEYIIRDHSDELFEKKKTYPTMIIEQLQKEFPDAKFELEIEDSYLNMKRQVEPVYHIIELATAAMENVGITPIIEPIRGGTDGSNLSYMGLPCPNIFAGGLNFHGPYEYVPVESMEKAVEVILEIINLSVK